MAKRSENADGVTGKNVTESSKTAEKGTVIPASDGQSKEHVTTSSGDVCSHHDGTKTIPSVSACDATTQPTLSGTKTLKSTWDLTPDRRLFLARAILAGLSVNMQIESMPDIEYVRKQGVSYDEKLRIIYSLIPASV